MRGSLQKSPRSLQLTLPGGWDEASKCPEKYLRGAENWENLLLLLFPKPALPLSAELLPRVLGRPGEV